MTEEKKQLTIDDIMDFARGMGAFDEANAERSRLLYNAEEETMEIHLSLEDTLNLAKAREEHDNSS